MLDGKVLESCIQSREAFDLVRNHINVDELSLQGQQWYPLIADWYAGEPAARSIDKEILVDKGIFSLPEGHIDTLVGWVRDLPEVDSPLNVVKHLIDLKRYQKGNELSQAIQGRQNEKIGDLLTEYTELRTATDLGRSEVTWTMDDRDMDSLLDRENLIKVAPKRLNEKLLGGAAPGDQILVFGRPEAFKTGFAVNMVAGFLKFGHTVLYVGNEEGTYKTRKRIINNLSNSDNDAYRADPEGTLEKARAHGFDGLHICHMQPGSPAEIEALVKEIKPKVVVVDQIRNLVLTGKSNDKLTDRLGNLATEMRSMAARHSFLSVALTQAGDKTERHGQEPPPWLTMSDVADNRTSLVAQYDVVLGVGCTEELRRTGMRAISICKNKLSDREDAHEGITVQVDVTRTKVR
jgi:hypothetical protein